MPRSRGYTNKTHLRGLKALQIVKVGFVRIALLECSFLVKVSINTNVMFFVAGVAEGDRFPKLYQDAPN